MKKIFLTLFFVPLFADFSVSTDVESALLMNLKTGRVLYEKRGYEQRYPASVTKIATALYVLEKCPSRLHESLVIPGHILKTVSMDEKRRFPDKYPPHTLEPDGSSIYLQAQEVMPVKALLCGLLLGSGNDAANALAFHCARDVAQFTSDVNRYLKEIGCKHTTFLNPHGLHHEDHLTTAYDLALMTQKALQNPTFAEIVKMTSFTRPETNKQKPSTIVQTNRLLRPGPYYYPKAYGVKTGYTSAAGYNLVAAATEGDRDLIAVILGAKTLEARYKNATALFEAAFKEKRITQKLFAKGADLFKTEIAGGNAVLKAMIDEDIEVNYYPSEPLAIQTRIRWFDKALPIIPTQVVGVFEVYDKISQTLVTRKTLIAQNTVDFTLMAKIKMKSGEIVYLALSHRWMILISLGLFGFAFYWARTSRKRLKQG